MGSQLFSFSSLVLFKHPSRCVPKVWCSNVSMLTIRKCNLQQLKCITGQSLQSVVPVA